MTEDKYARLRVAIEQEWGANNEFIWCYGELLHALLSECDELKEMVEKFAIELTERRDNDRG